MGVCVARMVQMEISQSLMTRPDPVFVLVFAFKSICYNLEV